MLQAGFSFFPVDRLESSLRSGSLNEAPLLLSEPVRAADEGKDQSLNSVPTTVPLACPQADLQRRATKARSSAERRCGLSASRSDG